jgi:hypothetical protein
VISASIRHRRREESRDVVDQCVAVDIPDARAVVELDDVAECHGALLSVLSVGVTGAIDLLMSA